MAIFLDELEEQLRRMNADLLALEAAPADPALLKSLLRGAHTLKGAARAAGVPEIEGTCHRLEALLTRARGGSVTLSPPEFELLFSALDALDDAGGRLRSGEDLSGTPIDELARLLDGGASSRRERSDPGGRAREPEAAAPEGARSGGADRGSARLNVEAEKVDALLASAGELLVATRRLADRPRRITDQLELATRASAAVRHLVRRSRPAPGEAGGNREVEAVEEALRDLVERNRELVADTAREARLLGRLASDLGDRMRGLRMRPFADACESLGRVVRDVANAGGKKVRLEVRGGEVAADRAVLDAVREALLHLVRNAVDHGIETPRVRAEQGKPETGVVIVEARLRGERLLVVVSDDGAGLDAAALRAQLERGGRQAPDDDEELGRALFEAGLTTRAEATPISGRGVGLDVVRSVAERVRGHVEVTWTAGGGTSFTLECPLSLAALRAVLVRTGDQMLALPTADVERLCRVAPNDLRRVDGRPILPGDDGPIPLVSLAAILGPPLPPLSAESPLPVVQILAGGRRLAVAVDELLSEEELIVRPIHPLRARPPQVAGMAVLGDGRLALVLDGAAVAGMGLASGAAGMDVAADAADAGPVRKTILVVDDSITTRTLEQSILTSAGYDVVTAGDGAEAWRILQSGSHDLVVSDVEMPGLDGFELCEKIRASASMAGLPVILVTALESAEHRARGFEVGADAYLPKSSFDQQELLDTIQRLIG